MRGASDGNRQLAAIAVGGASKAADPGARFNDDWRELRELRELRRVNEELLGVRSRRISSDENLEWQLGSWRRCDKAVGSLYCSVLFNLIGRIVLITRRANINRSQ